MTALLTWSALLAVVYVVLTGSSGLGHWVVGAALGLIATGLTRRALGSPPSAAPRRILASPRLVIATLGAILRGAWKILRALTRRRLTTRIVEVPMEDRSEEGAAVSGLVATMTPGSIYESTDDEGRALSIDEIDVDDAERSVEEHQRLYRRHQKPVVP